VAHVLCFFLVPVRGKAAHSRIDDDGEAGGLGEYQFVYHDTKLPRVVSSLATIGSATARTLFLVRALEVVDKIRVNSRTSKVDAHPNLQPTRRPGRRYHSTLHCIISDY
jgi:hypothetical protein